MNSYAILFLYLQMCLVQNVVTQYLGNYGTPSIGTGFADIASSNSYTGCNRPDSYGGVGTGNVAVAGELPVVGSTAVIAQVPVFGSVTYGGALPAAGTVFISDNCVCTCGRIPIVF